MGSYCLSVIFNAQYVMQPWTHHNYCDYKWLFTIQHFACCIAHYSLVDTAPSDRAVRPGVTYSDEQERNTRSVDLGIFSLECPVEFVKPHAVICRFIVDLQTNITSWPSTSDQRNRLTAAAELFSGVIRCAWVLYFDVFHNRMPFFPFLGWVGGGNCRGWYLTETNLQNLQQEKRKSVHRRRTEVCLSTRCPCLGSYFRYEHCYCLLRK